MNKSLVGLVDDLFSSSSQEKRAAALLEANSCLANGSDDIFFSIADMLLEKSIHDGIESYHWDIFWHEYLLDVFDMEGSLTVPDIVFDKVLRKAHGKCLDLEWMFSVDLREVNEILSLDNYRQAIRKIITDRLFAIYSHIKARGVSVRDVFGRPKSFVFTGRDYEEKICNALLELGWSATITGGTGDQGIDIIAVLGNCRVGVQCKFYNGNVGNDAVQQSYAGKQYHECNAVAVVSNSEYTKSAKQLAEKLEVFLLTESQLEEFTRKVSRP